MFGLYAAKTIQSSATGQHAWQWHKKVKTVYAQIIWDTTLFNTHTHTHIYDVGFREQIKASMHL